MISDAFRAEVEAMAVAAVERATAELDAARAAQHAAARPTPEEEIQQRLQSARFAQQFGEVEVRCGARPGAIKYLLPDAVDMFQLDDTGTGFIPRHDERDPHDPSAHSVHSVHSNGSTLSGVAMRSCSYDR